MYLWDTNILRYWGKGHPNFEAHLRRVKREQIALPSVVVAEALRGRCEYALKALPEQLQAAHTQLLELLQTLQSFHIIGLDQQSANVMLRLLKQHPSRKRYADLLITAMALAGHHIVVTRNTKDFADLLPALQLQNWIDDPPVN